MNSLKLIVLVLIVFLFLGCASPFARFYNQMPTPRDRLIYHNDDPKMFSGSDPEKDYIKLFEDGYLMIGYSSFNAGSVHWNGAIAQAKKIKANIVVTYSKYTKTESGVIPLTTPDRNISTTTSSGSVYGSRGAYGTYSGTSQTTTYGSSTTYMPYSIDRFEYLATYWVKAKSPTFGSLFHDLPIEIRQAMGTNKGVLVKAVVKNSPAYDSDIISGDVIKKVGDIEITDKHSFINALRKYAGQKVSMSLWRDGADLLKEVDSIKYTLPVL